MALVVVNAEFGREIGSSSSRRLRSQGMVPGIVYGTEAVVAVSFNAREFRNAFHGRSAKGAMISLKLPTGTKLARVQDIQRHPVKRELAHVDFQEIDKNEIINATVGVQAEDPTIEIHHSSIEVTGPAGSVPGSVDLTPDLFDAEGHITVASIKLPSNIVCVLESDTVIAVLAEVE
ncbi:MAG: 50S ribosomal protein L25 [Acidimicrobiaceae bacterium]|nr:50S ribosomal protein L25 [Acidimicrobiaceae bacterium]